MNILDDRKLHIPPFYTMEMMKYAAELEKSSEKIYHLEVGQPTVPTPPAVTQAAIEALKDSSLNYCSALGLIDLRYSIANHYHYAYGINISPNNIVITPGSSLGLYIALLMNFNKGANIAIASPSYPCYKNIIRSLGFNVIEIKTNIENGYLLMPDDLKTLNNSIDGVLIASPNNPTGSMYNSEKLKNFSEYCYANNILILSDEIYHGITYEEKAETILKYNENVIIINGFSKYFAMTGWRVGWLVVPQHDIFRYESLLQNMILCTSTLTQYAAIKAFSDYTLLNNYVEQYKTNLNILYLTLCKTGLTKIYKPLGAFYIYLELDEIELDSMEFCKKLLYEEGVAVAPGMDFSTEVSRCSIRLSFCQKQEIIEQAAIKLESFIHRL